MATEKNETEVTTDSTEGNEFSVDFRDYGVVHHPSVSLSRPITLGAAEKHIVRADDQTTALCGQELPDRADFYGFQGLEKGILAGMKHRCSDCVEALKRE